MSERFDINRSGLDQDVIQPILFADLDFEDWPMFAHTGLGVVSWGGMNWLGLGDFVHIEPVNESFELRPTRIKMGMALPNQDLLRYVTTYVSAGRRVILYIGNMDGNGQLIDTPNLIFYGVMGPPSLAVGEENVVSIEVTDVRDRFGSINGLRASLEDHQETAPGDLFYKWLPKMIDHRFIFNGIRQGGGGRINQNSTRTPGYRPPPQRGGRTFRN